MSIFGSIVNKIFGHANAASGPGQFGTPGTQAGTAPQPANFNNPAPTASGPGQTTPASPSGSSTQASAAPASTGSKPAAPGSAPVDASAILAGLAAKNSQKLDWQHSIVDLMKLLDLDSSLHARQQLATELHYSGSTDDTASMNIWLHKEVMQKLAENGGKVPADLH